MGTHGWDGGVQEEMVDHWPIENRDGGLLSQQWRWDDRPTEDEDRLAGR